MKTTDYRNFHVPLPLGTYHELKREAARVRRPATKLIREVIETWLEQRRHEQLHQAIANYAAQHAGTALDLDPELEQVAVSQLLEET